MQEIHWALLWGFLQMYGTAEYQVMINSNKYTPPHPTYCYHTLLSWSPLSLHYIYIVNKGKSALKGKWMSISSTTGKEEKPRSNYTKKKLSIPLHINNVSTNTISWSNLICAHHYLFDCNRYMRLRRAKLSADSFEEIKLIGRGAFGEVLYHY